MVDLISLENITFVITTFRSNNTIFNCLDSIPSKIKKIIIENSQDEKIKSILEKKYENLKCFLMDENLGYGKGNNFGIKKSITDYVFILNPDTILSPNFLEKFLEKIKFEKYSIAAPLEENDNNNYSFENNGIVDVCDEAFLQAHQQGAESGDINLDGQFNINDIVSSIYQIMNNAR